jgi:hypothetical protein
MGAVEPREGSDRVLHASSSSSPAAPAAADEVKMEDADALGEQPAAAPRAASEAEHACDVVGASVTDPMTEVNEGGAAGGEHSDVPAAKEVVGDAGSIHGEGRDAAPLVSDEPETTEAAERGAASNGNSAASTASEVNAGTVPEAAQDPASEMKMEVDGGCCAQEQECTAAAVEGGEVKTEEGDGRVANQGSAAPARGLRQVREEVGECLVGRYVGRSAPGHARILIGKVASYDSTTGAYSVVFEDGHGEDLGLPQLQEFLMSDENGALGMKVSCRKRKLDLLVSSGSGSEVKEPASTRQRVDGSESSARPEAPQHSGSGSDMSEDIESSSNSSDFTEEGPSEPCPPVQAVELPPSSGDIPVPEEFISYLFSVYNFLRSFSVQLFLSPFGLDDFVAAINCSVQNNLLDAVHVSLLRALRRHLESKSAGGSQLASNCLK